MCWDDSSHPYPVAAIPCVRPAATSSHSLDPLAARVTCRDEAAPIPGPHDALRLVERGAEAVNALLDAVPRVTALLDEAESLVTRAGAVLDRLEGTRTAADQVVRRADAVVTEVEGVVERVDRVVTEAVQTLTRTDGAVADAARTLERTDSVVNDAVRTLTRTDDVVNDAVRTLTRADGAVADAGETLGRTGGVVEQAEQAVTTTEGVLGRVVRLVDLTEPSLVKLQPTLDRLAETTDPAEVDALVTLVDHLPQLVERFEGEMLPIVRSLQTVAPDIHDLLDLSRALNEMLGAVPGLGRVKKRIDEDQEDEEDD